MIFLKAIIEKFKHEKIDYNNILHLLETLCIINVINLSQSFL